ncbi:MAG: phage terminase large subunit [Acetobacteraceae bacterium]
MLALSGYEPARHHHLLLGLLNRVSLGEIDRLMVLMPPGSAKSTYASVLFPAWWFVQHPRSSVIAASHTADLAAHFGRQVRALIAEHSAMLGYRLTADNRAASRWQTSSRGEYFATGVRGPMAGRRADLAIIDDPIKSTGDAESATQRERLWDWYRSDLTTRLKPRGRVVLIMTRWHEEDLAGRLLERSGAEWEVIRLPALAEVDDPLMRAVGEPLWPEWEDREALDRRRSLVGERRWGALYQQSPRPVQGALFKVAHIEVVDAIPPGMLGPTVRAWDLAATVVRGGNDPDWTVGVKVLRDPSGRWVVLDIVRFRGSPGEVQQAIALAADVDGRGVVIALPEDPGQAGKAQVSHLAKSLAGYNVKASRETGSKIVRATPLAAQVEAGNLALLRAQWNHTLIDELRDFPYGRKDDQVDALARAFHLLSDRPSALRRIAVPIIDR